MAINKEPLTRSGLDAPRLLEELVDQGVFAVVDEDYGRVERFLLDQTQAQFSIAPTVVRHLLEAGGKRIRPIVHFLAAGLCGYTGKEHVTLAAVSEMIHSATLFHDDVIDEGTVRRGRPTANRIWGNEKVILVGDFIFARAFTIMMGAGHYRIARYLGETVEDLVLGELLQLEQAGNRALTREQYLEIVRCKTGSLFSWCARSAAMVAELAQDRVDAMARFGHHLGIAFQISDDVLDYAGASLEMGKSNFSDLAEGKTTLPLILAREDDDILAGILDSLPVDEPGMPLERLEEVARRVLASNGIAGSLQTAQEHVEFALSILEEFPDSPYRDGLAELCRFTVSRIH